MAVFSDTKIYEYLTISDNADSSTGEGRNIKGEALTDLICYLFEKTPGIELTAKNVTNIFHSEEIDIVFWNEQVVKAFYF